MKKQNYDDLEIAAEKRSKKRESKKRKKMKISGGQVKDLQKIIISKHKSL